MKTRSYSSPTAFRQALERRLANLAKEEGIDIQRLRRQVAFDRLLARLFADPSSIWLLKGGYAMELRLQTARTTRDIDLMARCLPRGEADLSIRLLRLLQDAASLDMGDCFGFAIGEAMMDFDAAPYGGARFPVEARMDGRTFARFHLDVAAGGPVLEPLETVNGRDWLGFAGIQALSLAMISKEQQFAEKLHAYSLPRTGPVNTRVRDLLDMMLLVEAGLDLARTYESIQSIFDRRKTHAPPEQFPSPPDSWVIPFAALAEECGADMSIEAAVEQVAHFYTGLT
jgi:hypothetical protein